LGIAEPVEGCRGQRLRPGGPTEFLSSAPYPVLTPPALRDESVPFDRFPRVALWPAKPGLRFTRGYIPPALRDGRVMRDRPPRVERRGFGHRGTRGIVTWSGSSSRRADGVSFGRATTLRMQIPLGHFRAVDFVVHEPHWPERGPMWAARRETPVGAGPNEMADGSRSRRDGLIDDWIAFGARAGGLVPCRYGWSLLLLNSPAGPA
jgi:hypothetical protein